MLNLKNFINLEFEKLNLSTFGGKCSKNYDNYLKTKNLGFIDNINNLIFFYINNIQKIKIQKFSAYCYECNINKIVNQQ